MAEEDGDFRICSGRTAPSCYDAAFQCASCGRKGTPLVRSGPPHMPRICNACGLKYAKWLRDRGLTLPTRQSSNEVTRAARQLHSMAARAWGQQQAA